MDFESRSLCAAIAEYGVCQHYRSYTPREQQTWREVIAALAEVLETRSAVPYMFALERCGLSSERIPKLIEINHALRRLGWSSTIVAGFIPPQLFMLFQANRVLPITRHVRSSEQRGYTPIPDIIHEAAGHLPMLVDINYRRFMKRFGELGMRIKFGSLDEKVFLAQKEFAEAVASPFTDRTYLADLEQELTNLRSEQKCEVTVACLISRFHWWTVEYGLLGSSEKIIGAGLLSSSREALASDHTPKYCLSLDCLEQDYEISRMQPQLYVAEDWDHLNSELDLLFSKVA